MRRNGLLALATALAVLASAAPAPAADAAQRAWAVSCAAPSACTAVGDRFDTGGAQHSGVQRWDGTGWAAQAFPTIPDAVQDGLTAVACPTTTLCFATVWAQTAGAHQTAFVARWSASTANPSGTWSLEPLPAPPAPWEGWLTSISCTAADACTAVGSMDDHTNGDTARTLAYRWNGAGWTLQQPANLRSQIHRLYDVACATASFCVAVGLTESGPLMETWDGGHWSIGSPAAPPGATHYDLRAVSCTADDACTVVGGYLDDNGYPRTLAERWNGSDWTLQDIPSVQAQNWLSDVSCSSPTDCVAVGEGFPQAFGSLIERWEDQAWSIDQITPRSGRAPLEGVSCSTPVDCMAVGWAVLDGGATRPVYERFSGTGWTDVSDLVATSPPPPPPPPPPHRGPEPPPHGRHNPCPHNRRHHRHEHRHRNSAAGACVSIRRWSRTDTAAKANGASRAARRCTRARAHAPAARRCLDCSARSPGRRSPSS